MPSRAISVTVNTAIVAGFDAQRRTITFFNNGGYALRLAWDIANLQTNGIPLARLTGVSFKRVDGDEVSGPFVAVIEAKEGAGDDETVELIITQSATPDLIDAIDRMSR